LEQGSARQTGQRIAINELSNALFALAEGYLRLLALADVAGDHQPADPSPPHDEARRRELYGQPRAIFSHQLRLQEGGLGSPGEGALAPIEGHRHRTRGNQHGAALPQQLFDGIPGQLLQLGVGECDPSGRVQDIEGIGQGLHEQPIVFR